MIGDYNRAIQRFARQHVIDIGVGCVDAIGRCRTRELRWIAIAEHKFGLGMFLYRGNMRRGGPPTGSDYRNARFLSSGMIHGNAFLFDFYRSYAVAWERQPPAGRPPEIVMLPTA
mgnify:CR=1 FL=1